MKIEFGKAIVNKTWRFLAPTLKGHGDIFVSKFNSDVFKLAYGIHDTLLDGAEIIENRRPLFILCDKGVNRHKFESFLEWIKYKDFYIADYLADENINNPRKHMLVLEVPKQFFNAYDKFQIGLYSEMYSKEELNLLFKDKESKDYKILSKCPTYRDIFIEKVEKEFETVISDKNSFSNAELEFPYKLGKEEEIFNCC